MREITGLGALALRDALRAGELSAVETVDAHLGAIAGHSHLGAFVTVTEEAARRAARRADERFAAAGDRAALPALHGLPVAHKDLTDVAGAPTTRGSAAVPHAPAPADGAEAATLRAAGAISLGKTQVPEFGLTGYSENAVAPPARNPLDPDRTPGGSSGGSAAAVAAHLLPVAPGSDGGGSIRIPALACGLVGLKPGLGAIPFDPARGETDDFGAPRLTVTGPLARCAADAAILFDALRGAAHEPALAAVRRAGDVRGLRIGVSAQSPFAEAWPTPLDADAREAFELAQRRLDALGHRLEEAAFDYSGYPEHFLEGWTAGLSLLDLAPGAERRLMPLTRAFRERALARGRESAERNGAWLRGFAARVREQWGAYDAVLTPGLTGPPPLIGEFLALAPDADYRLQCTWAPYTSMVNVSGMPAVAVPVPRAPCETGGGDATRDRDGDRPGLPTGVQLIGRPASEPLLLQLTEQLAGNCG